MLNYGAFFGFNKNTNISEVIEKLALFLSRICESASGLTDEKEKREILNAALKTIQDVCFSFSINSDCNRYDEYSQEQIIISDKQHRLIKNVIPLEEFYKATKRSWVRVLTCLIPALEKERQMFFLPDEENMVEVLSFIVDNAIPCFTSQNSNKPDYVISLDIIKRSFDIAKKRGRTITKVEDLVSAINECQFLDERSRVKMAIMIFDRWYRVVDLNHRDKSYAKRIQE